MSDDQRQEVNAPGVDEPDSVEASVESPELDKGEPLVAAEEMDPRESVQRDALSIALVAVLAALLLICVLLIFVANRHRPAGL